MSVRSTLVLSSLRSSPASTPPLSRHRALVHRIHQQQQTIRSWGSSASSSTTPQQATYHPHAQPQQYQQYTQYAYAHTHAPHAHSHSHHTHHSSSTDWSRAFRKWSVRLLLAIAFPTTYLLGAAMPPKIILMLYPRYSPPPPDKDSSWGKALTGELEEELQHLGLVEKMRTKEGWYETRPYARFDPQKVRNSLTAGTLRGPGKLAAPPIVFSKHDESEAVAVIHLGRALCGHDGIVHGGLLSTVFDESLARNALLNLPSHIGVTANLNINFKSPCMADQFVIVRTKLDNKQGRKVWVSGSMETLDGEKVAEASALFVEPKWAQFLQSSGVTEALGRPMPRPDKSPAIMDDQTEHII